MKNRVVGAALSSATGESTGMKRPNIFESFRFRKALKNCESGKSSFSGNITPQSSSHVKQNLLPRNSRTVTPTSRQPGGKVINNFTVDCMINANQANTDVFKEQQGGLPEKLGSEPLRLIIVGHNPSEHAWSSGHYYSNPSNRMWSILIVTGIAPEGIRGSQDDDCMLDHGIGFTDVGTGNPGTDSSEFKSLDFHRWRQDFYDRMQDHMKRASDSIGCNCSQCGAPALVAFAGKRQYLELLNWGKKGKNKSRTVPFGVQTELPDNWPCPRMTEVWVCPSTSGAAAMTTEQRIGPYRALAARLQNLPALRKLQCPADIESNSLYPSMASQLPDLQS